MKAFTLTGHYHKPLIHATWACFWQHLFWILLFFWLNIPLLSLINVVSCCLYIAFIFLVKRRLYGLFCILVIAEILLNISFTTYIMGWTAGFHYFLFIIIYGTFFVPRMKLSEKILVIVINISVYLVLKDTTAVAQIAINAQYLKYISSLNIISVFIIIAVLSAFFRKTVDVTLNEMQEIASIDPLTGLFNRRTMYEKLEEEMRRADRAKGTFSILLADVDNFKGFNDEHGHDCGDLVLMQCADILRESARTFGAVSRWGGEEFLILLHSADAKTSPQFAEKLRKKISDQVFLYQDLQFKMSITIGVATYHQHEKIAEVIKRADQALLSGKKEGRNIVKTATL